MESVLHDLIRRMPKAELHLHIEGSLEPEMLFDFARRNGVAIPYDSVESVRAAYNFTKLQDFLDLYYQGMGVIRTRQDFHDLMAAYLARCRDENIVHVEVFFDPQAHLARGIEFTTMLDGLTSALDEAAARDGITSKLILSFLRHLSQGNGFKVLDRVRPHRERIFGVGLASSEDGHPPSDFTRLFDSCRDEGYRLFAHAGEEGPADYVRQAVELLKVDRIDHGVRAMEDPELVRELAERRIPLTVCPLSNARLRVVDRLENHPLRRMLEAGLMVTVNSDDPAYFGGYLTENWLRSVDALKLDRAQVRTLARNAFEASFMDGAAKAARMAEIDELFG